MKWLRKSKMTCGKYISSQTSYTSRRRLFAVNSSQHSPLTSSLFRSGGVDSGSVMVVAVMVQLMIREMAIAMRCVVQWWDASNDENADDDVNSMWIFLIKSNNKIYRHDKWRLGLLKQCKQTSAKKHTHTTRFVTTALPLALNEMKNDMMTNENQQNVMKQKKKLACLR